MHQVMTEEQANNMPYNSFDLTKVCSQHDPPLSRSRCRWSLTRNPENYFQDEAAHKNEDSSPR